MGVYHKSYRILLLSLSVVLIAAMFLFFRIEIGAPISIVYCTGVMLYTLFKRETFSGFLFDIPLPDITGVGIETISRKKEMLAVTKTDGRQCLFCVDRADSWLTDVQGAMKKR